MNKHLRASAKDMELGDFKTIAESTLSRGGTRAQKSRKNGTRTPGEPTEMRPVNAAAR
jgi:hypothetical protein